MKVTISPTDDLTTCLDLRRIVFIDEQGVSEEDELDAYDATATHLLAMDGDRPVGTARIVIKGRVGKIGRVCVLKSHRGAGLGAGLIMAALDILANDPGITSARLGAQVQALEFYRKLGFAEYGPVYDDAGIPHKDMERAV